MLRRVALLCSLGLLACSAGNVDDTGGAAREGELITRGEVDAQTRAVVALVVNGNHLASAVLIAPGVLLTAAHAVHPSFLGRRVYAAGVSAETDVILGRTRLVRIRPEDIHIHPEFDPERVLLGHDLAVVTVPASTLAGAAPLEITRATDAFSFAAPVRVVGYGAYRRTDPASAGTRRTAATLLGPTNEQLVLVGGEGAPQACVGDSGGPTLVMSDGQERVLSLASFITKSDARCTEGNYNTRIDANLDFLTPFLPARSLDPGGDVGDLGVDQAAPPDAAPGME